MEETEKLIIALTGKDSETFERLFSKLTNAIEKAVSVLSPDEMSHGTEENIRDVVEITKNFMQAKLQKPSLENQKLLAEIAMAYAEAEEKLASTAKIRAETKSIELDNALKQLQHALQAIQVIKQVQTFLLDNDHFVIDILEDRKEIDLTSRGEIGM